MFQQFLAWYLVVQLITLVSLPLGFGLFVNLPDRGYAFAKSLGILLVGFTLWLGTSYGLLRNEAGGAWLAVIIVAAASLWLGSQQHEHSGNTLAAGLRSTLAELRANWRYVLVIEILFLVAFALWAMVRSYDPAANHTEKPMDLMFMNSIWVSPTFPPRDAWLSGYAISYYYFGYWLLTTLGRLAAQPPEIAYVLGQACWYGLLCIGCFGVVYNLVSNKLGIRNYELRRRTSVAALVGGALAVVAVAVAGNWQGLLEYLYSKGYAINGLANWLAVANFPPGNPPSGQWYNGFDWWWWRSSRVIEDLNLAGQHLEVIDEFPSFSYMLGDNHPHVLAMPIVLLVIGLAMNLFFAPRNEKRGVGRFAQLLTAMPLGWAGLAVLTIVTGGLIFLNTWDFPPYWLLITLSFFVFASRTLPNTVVKNILLTGGFALVVLVATGVLYLPYFLTAQSQAGGFVPNLFFPTRFPNFVLMFGTGLCGLLTLISLAWRSGRPPTNRLLTVAGIIYGLPLLFLVLSTFLALNVGVGQELLRSFPLPPGATGYLPIILERWLQNGLTFVVLGALLTVIVTLLWQQLAADIRPLKNSVENTGEQANRSTYFALLLATLGLLLVYAPEFIYLRDQFGTRMNTIFKFYYQGWLLFGLSGSYAIVTVLREHTYRGAKAITEAMTGASVCAALTLLGIGVGLFYPFAAFYAKTSGFASPEPTFSAIAYVEQENPAEAAAIAWVRENVAPAALLVEGKGLSYRANYSRMSAATGRPTLLGWDGHENQWRGKRFGKMAGGRAEALEKLYRNGSVDEIAQLVEQWQMDYVYVGPAEREQYAMTPLADERFAAALDLVFSAGNVRIYQRRNR